MQSLKQVKPASIALVSVNEKEELAAQKAFYDRIDSEMGRKKSKKLHFWRKVSLIYSPTFALLFVAIYWISGLKHANII